MQHPAWTLVILGLVIAGNAALGNGRRLVTKPESTGTGAGGDHELTCRGDRLHDFLVKLRPPLLEIPAVLPSLPHLVQIDRGGDVAFLRLRAGGHDAGGPLADHRSRPVGLWYLPKTRGVTICGSLSCSTSVTSVAALARSAAPLPAAIDRPSRSARGSDRWAALRTSRTDSLQPEASWCI